MRKIIILIQVCLITLISCKSNDLPDNNTIDSYLNTNISSDYDIPSIGEWLFYKNKRYADWLGVKYYNRYLREPINIIIIDSDSESAQQAVKKLLRECKMVGYEEEYGHSSGYMGVIDNEFYRQVPNNRHMAFANKDFFVTNNHGRIIGPAFYNGKYVFIAGFSTERPSIFKGVHHLFVSFNKARNDFSLKLNDGSVYKIIGSMDLKNTINTNTTTTADHDGKVIVFETRN
jgi:hypothetical protein